MKYIIFYKKYPKRDRKKLAFIGCFVFIEKLKKMTKRSIFSISRLVYEQKIENKHFISETGYHKTGYVETG
jgi:hypothetical protein